MPNDVEETKVANPDQPVSPPTPPATPPATDPPVHPGIDWLNTAPVDEIVRHPRFGGILGQREQVLRDKITKEINDAAARKARDDAEQEMTRLANEDPVTFAQRYLSEKEQARLKEQESTLRSGIRQDFAKKIGETFRNLAEWQELTPEEYSKLQAAVADKNDEEALGAFNLAALDIVAERRSNKRLADWRAKDLAKEREALRVEEAAKLLKNSARPDMTQGTRPAPFDPRRLSDAEFSSWYEKNIK